ncbi:hypothetical protein ACFC4G_47550 [Streptomyces sp. NPDC056002]|uniref:hypothetical protein n=1 Tax=Streptomyces sp. NPDC056002 TaxID=3345675 RepID=UPI0035D9D7C4
MVVHPPLSTGGRRVTARGLILGLAEVDVDVIEFALMSDYRGEPLDEVLQRFTESSGRAWDLAGCLHGQVSKAHLAVGYLAHSAASEVPDQEPAGAETETDEV